jgi:class 3 adenylate cyclase
VPEDDVEDDAAAMSGSVVRSIAFWSAAANLLGAATVFVYLQWLSPRGAVDVVTDPHDVRTTAVVFVVYMAVALTGGSVAIGRYARRWVAWLVADVTPTDEEHRRTLQLPAFSAGVFLLGWAGAAVVFGAEQGVLGSPPTDVARISVGILFAGLVTSGLGFAVVERSFRPAIAAALVGHEEAVSSRGLGIRARLGLAWGLGSAVPLVSVALAAATLQDVGWSVRLPVVALAVLGLLSGGLMTRATANAVAIPLERLRSVVEAVRDGDLEATVEVDDGGDVGLLQIGVNRMVEATRERVRVQELFGRHVGVAVARRALEGQDTGNRSTTASALFADVIGSTGMARSRPADEVVGLLNAFFQCVVEATDAEGGLVNKFEGDGALCIFGPPGDEPDHADRALAAARRLRALLSERMTGTGLDAAIGVSTGIVVAGNVGAADRFEYTVIGDAVNEASRLTELAKHRHGGVLASRSAVDAAGPAEAGCWEPAGTVELRGRGTPTELWRPVPDGAATGAGAQERRPATR